MKHAGGKENETRLDGLGQAGHQGRQQSTLNIIIFMIHMFSYSLRILPDVTSEIYVASLTFLILDF